MKPSVNNDFGDISEEDQLLQETLLNSNKKSKVNKNVPKDVPKDFMS